MRDPPKPDPSPIHPTGNQSSRSPGLPAAAPFRGAGHRRAQSEVQFRIPEDLDLLSDPFDGPSGSFEELGSEDDLFCTYMDIEKFGSEPVPKPDGGVAGAGGDEKSSRPRHRHSSSVDCSAMLETIEAKKAMAPDKLAELWSIDPKRAKRYDCECVCVCLCNVDPGCEFRCFYCGP